MLTSGLTILLASTIVSSCLTMFNIIMWNEWSHRGFKAISIAINLIVFMVATIFWVALADGISREAYICKTYAQRV